MFINVSLSKCICVTIRMVDCVKLPQHLPGVAQSLGCCMNLYHTGLFAASLPVDIMPHNALSTAIMPCDAPQSC